MANQPVEWNAIGDPHATAICYNAQVAPHVSVGIDVTRRCTMPADECRERLKGGVLDPVADMAEVWFSHGRPVITFHDPLAAAIIFEPGICKYEQGKVEVELLSDRVKGMTHWAKADDGPNRIAADVDVDRFFKHYFEVVSG